LQILSHKTLPSTQEYLKELLQTKKFSSPIAVTCDIQTQGIGSRDNKWDGLEGNLFVSFSLSLETLPKDLKIESASIYFAYILKVTLEELGSKVWLKWPNDFYIDSFKIGGMITNIIGKDIICGFGLNLVKAPNGFSMLDIKLEKTFFLKKYFENL